MKLLRNFAGTLSLLYATAIFASSPFNTIDCMVEALVSNDYDSLEELLDKDYQHTHNNGHVENKKEFIDALKNGDRRFVAIDFLNRTALNLSDDAYLVRGEYHLTAINKEGNQVERDNLVSYVITGDEILNFQATGSP